MRKIDVSVKLLGEIEHLIRYSTEPDSQIIKYGCRNHPLSRKIYSSQEKSYRDKETQRLRVTITALFQHILSKNRPFQNSRCPECGKKLITRRCFICDLENGLIKESY